MLKFSTILEANESKMKPFQMKRFAVRTVSKEKHEVVLFLTTNIWVSTELVSFNLLL